MGVSLTSCLRRAFGLIGLTATISAGTAAAQNAIEVKEGTEREKQQLRDTGFKAGALEIRPQFGVTGEYTDNVFYSSTNKRSDALVDARASIAFKTLFSRHELRADLWVNQVAYARYSGEDVTQFGGSAGGRIDVDRATAIEFDGGYQRLAESRYSLNANRTSQERAKYDTLFASASASRQFNNFWVRLGGRVADYSYDSVRVAGVDTSQKIRDFRVYAGSLDLVYGKRDPTRFVVHGEIERRDYQIGFGDPGFDSTKFVDRSADGYRIEVGVQREITDLIQGTIRVGYLHYNYDDPRIKTFSAFSYHGDLVWNVTPLTSIVATADRKLDETVSPLATGNLRDEFGLAFEHELRRDVILFGDLRYARVRLVNATTRSREFEGEFGARYYLGDHFVISASVRHSQRHSGVSAIDYDTNSAMISAKVRF